MAESNTKQTCSSCLFFTGSGNLGTCRRYPPSTTKSPNEWCGEYKQSVINLSWEEIASQPVLLNSLKGSLFEPTKKRGRPAKK